MPIYEYRCEQCGHIMEVWAKMADPPPAECAQCQAASPQKIVSRTSFQLKGGGWYAQGYGAGSGGGASSSGGGGASGGSASTSTPAAAPATAPAAAPAPAPSPPSGGGSGSTT